VTEIYYCPYVGKNVTKCPEPKCMLSLCAYVKNPVEAPMFGLPVTNDNTVTV